MKTNLSDLQNATELAIAITNVSWLLGILTKSNQQETRPKRTLHGFIGWVTKATWPEWPNDRPGKSRPLDGVWNWFVSEADHNPADAREKGIWGDPGLCWHHAVFNHGRALRGLIKELRRPGKKWDPERAADDLDWPQFSTELREHQFEKICTTTDTPQPLRVTGLDGAGAQMGSKWAARKRQNDNKRGGTWRTGQRGRELDRGA